MILHVHCEETDKLNLIEVAKEFVEKNDRRKQVFWTILLTIDNYM